MGEIPMVFVSRDLGGQFLQSLAVWRPLLSLAGSQKYSRCQSKTAQFDKPGPLLQVAVSKNEHSS